MNETAKTDHGPVPEVNRFSKTVFHQNWFCENRFSKSKNLRFRAQNRFFKKWFSQNQKDLVTKDKKQCKIK